MLSDRPVPDDELYPFDLSNFEEYFDVSLTPLVVDVGCRNKLLPPVVDVVLCVEIEGILFKAKWKLVCCFFRVCYS